MPCQIRIPFVIRAKGPKSNGILKGLNFEDIPEKSGTDTTVRLKVRRNKDGIYKHTVSKGWNSDTDMILSLRVVIKELPNGDFEYLSQIFLRINFLPVRLLIFIGFDGILKLRSAT